MEIKYITMKLNLIDELTLLSLDDEKGTFISDSTSFQYGIAGAIILELTIKDKIKILDKKVIVKTKVNVGDKLLDIYLKLISQSKKERSLKDWIQIIGEKENEIKTITIDKLIANGILTKKEGKILWLFANNKYPTRNSLPENELRKRLIDIIENDKKPEITEVMLLSLIQTCDLIKEVFGKQKPDRVKKKIKMMVENTKLTHQIDQTVIEVHDSIMAAVAVMISVTIVTTIT